MGGVNLVVSCTKRKTREAREAFRLRNLPAANVEDRAAEWIRCLRAERTRLVPAAELYAGDHWKVVRAIAASGASAGLPLRVWVCSAGYGLVSIESRLAPYDATFAPGQADSVVRHGQRTQATLAGWWAALGAWEGPPGAACRSIAALAESYPDDFLLVALSEGYLKAVSADLRDAAVRIPNPDCLAVICAGAGTVAGLERHLLPCDARLQGLAGGALTSLNVRLARRLLADSRNELSLPGCRALFQRWMSTRPERAAASRTPTSDEAVRAFIRGALAKNPGLRPTPLLQRLRGQGRACEHRRFARLFREVEGLTDAPA